MCENCEIVNTLNKVLKYLKRTVPFYNTLFTF